MSATGFIAIFGAAVRADGAPSSALLRRIGYGERAARDHPEAPVLCSGGVGRAGPSEASIMARVLIGRGLPAERLILDEDSFDTLQSVAAVTRLSRTRGGARAIICSDDYHLPRIRMMLRVLGVPTSRGPVPRGPGSGSIGHWSKMALREAAAIPYDLAIVLARRDTLGS